MLGGIAGRYGLRPIGDNTTRWLLLLLRHLEHPPHPVLQALAGSIWGVAMNYGSQVGYYHSFFLPLILLEMESGTPSFFGALDYCTLCLVSGGICLASVITSRANPDLLPLGKRGALINLLWGDFVEACYPYMSSSPGINLSAYLASAISGALIARYDAKSSAYLPWFISLTLGPQSAIAYAALVAFGVPFTITLAANLVAIMGKL